MLPLTTYCVRIGKNYRRTVTARNAHNAGDIVLTRLIGKRSDAWLESTVRVQRGACAKRRR